MCSVPKSVVCRYLLKYRRFSKCLNGNRHYAMYKPEHYMQPIVDKDLLESMEGESLKELKYKLFKPAGVSENVSIFYDDKYKRFVNYIMKEGNKALARDLMDKTFYEIKKHQLKKYHEAENEEDRNSVELNPLVIFHKAIENCKPILDVVPVKRGAIVYQVPVPLAEFKSEYKSIQWILQAARDKGTRVHLPTKLSKELIDAYNKEGRVMQKKQDLHKLCETNRAYAHFRW